MPKDEFEFDDPMELNGVGFACNEDTTDAMTECFVEEFMRLGYNAKQIHALFRNPHYLGMNMVVQNRGEQFVRDRITEVFARWGKPVAWAEQGRAGFQPATETNNAADSVDAAKALGLQDACPTLTDPTGVPITKLNP